MREKSGTARYKNGISDYVLKKHGTEGNIQLKVLDMAGPEWAGRKGPACWTGLDGGWGRAGQGKGRGMCLHKNFCRNRVECSFNRHSTLFLRTFCQGGKRVFSPDFLWEVQDFPL